MTERTLRDQIAELIYDRDILDADEIRDLLARHDARTAAQPAPERNWTEDYTRENGNYVCICLTCKQEFIGHKRRATCKACAAAQPAPDAVAEARIADDNSLASRISELGWQIHNLGCEYQNDEKLLDRLQELRGTAWEIADIAREGAA